jgi:hypothetical protein
MKARLTVTLDPTIVRKAKALALSRDTNFSALIETLLRADIANEMSIKSLFAKKWQGKLKLRELVDDDVRAHALIAKYERPLDEGFARYPCVA